MTPQKLIVIIGTRPEAIKLAEVPSLGKPILVLREITERPEGVERGIAKIVGTSKTEIVQKAQELLNNLISMSGKLLNLLISIPG